VAWKRPGTQVSAILEEIWQVQLVLREVVGGPPTVGTVAPLPLGCTGAIAD